MSSNIAELDVPTVEHYENLQAYMKAKFRGASEVALEHLDALEALLDVCIAAGYAKVKRPAASTFIGSNG